MTRRTTKTRDRISTSDTHHGGSQATPTISRGKILLADDDCENSKALCLELLNAGYEVETVHDGTSTTARTIDGHPDVLILDLGVPATDGLAVLERLRSHPTTLDTPIVVLLSSTDPGITQRVSLHSDVACFQKQGTGAEIVSFIGSTLGR